MSDKIHLSVGKRLKYARKLAGHTQKAFSDLVMRDRSMISRMESGSVEIDVETLRIFAKALGTSEEWLFSGTGDPPPRYPEVLVEKEDDVSDKTSDGLESPGDRVRHARVSMKMNQGDLSNVIGRDRSTVSKIESNVATLTPATARKIAKVTGTTPEWLLFGTGNAPEMPEDEVVEQPIRRPNGTLVVVERMAQVVSAEVGFQVTEMQALEWFAVKANMRSRVFGD